MTCPGPPRPGLWSRASRLALLRQAGLRVPEFVAIDVGCDHAEVVSSIRSLGGPPYVLRWPTPSDLGPSRPPLFSASLDEALNLLRSWSSAAVVQRAVMARASGFAYTMNPVDGDPTLIYIDSVVGLGLRLSQEGAFHDELRVTRDGLKVYDVRIMWKGSAQFLGPNGVEERPLNDPWVQSISDEEAKAVASAALAAERAAGVPVELAWAIDASGQLWALGLRPLRPARS